MTGPGPRARRLPRLRLPRLPRPLRTALARHRRALAAGLAALAVLAGLQALRPAPAPSTRLPVAARDLPAGHRLAAGDLEIRSWPATAAPAGAVERPLGRVLASPVRRGEPVTDVRVAPVGGSGRSSGSGGSAGSAGSGRSPATAVPAGWVAATLRPSDAAAAALVVPGDHVQIVAGAAVDALGASRSAPARVVVADALVLATPGSTGPAASADAAASAAPAEAEPGGTGTGLLGSLGGSAAAPSGGGSVAGAGGLPAGVIAVAVSAGDALDLAAVDGVRSLHVYRHFSMSS